MKATLSQYLAMSREDQDKVTHLDIDDKISLPRSDCSQWEQHEGEARSRGLTSRGFNK